MSTMISEVYDAFVEAGASQDKARRATEAMANYDDKFVAVNQRLAKIEGELNLLKWMIGIQFAGVAALVMKAFFS